MNDYTSNYDEYLNAKDSLLNNRINETMAVEELSAGTSAGSITDGVFGATNNNNGIEFKNDVTNSLSYIQSRNFVSGTTGFRFASDGTIEGASLTLTGGTIKYGKTSFADTTNAGYHVSSSGFYFGSASDASYVKYNIGTATFAIKASLEAIAGSSLSTAYLSGLIAQGNLNVANRGWTQTSAFSVTDADTVAWGVGTFTSADGTAYSIGAGNTGNMSAKTYIYLDTAVSTTAYQTTTTSTTAVGAGKVLVAIAQNGTTEATYQVMQGQGGQNIDAANIVAGSITANEIAASTITAGLLSVSTLSSITANLGTITAGTITIDSSGYVRGGQTAYNTGTGFFLGYSTSAYKFSIGNPSGDWMTWDGTNLQISLLNSIAVALGNTLQHSNDTQKTADAGSYTKIKEIKINQALGALRVKFTDAAGASSSLYTRLYKNGVAIGTENLNNNETPETRTEDLGSVAVNDLIQVYAYKTGSNGGYVKDFRFYFDATLTKLYNYTLTTPLGVTWQWVTAPTNQDP